MPPDDEAKSAHDDPRPSRLRDGGLHLLEWARRRVAPPPPGNAVADLVEGRSDEEIEARRGLPRAAVRGVRSFYDGVARPTEACDGTACHFAGGAALAERLRAGGAVGAVRCLGHCYAAPSYRRGDSVVARPIGEALEGWLETAPSAAGAPPIPRRSLVEPPVVLRNLVGAGRRSALEEYDLPGGEAILAAIAETGLRGRGGAAFPTAAKWRAARDAEAGPRYVVANGDEGDPGSYVDRLLLEEDPHAVLAGMLACARAIGARHGIVYVRGEYPRARAAMGEAIREARRAARIGAEFDVEVVSGAGSYVCGEETALLNSIQGLRGEPRPRPPYPAEHGLWGRPTVVQNVETLAVVPWLARTGRGSGTKAASLSGAVARPGVVEVKLGTPLAQVLEEGGGGAAPGRRWRMALVGGPMGRVVPASRFAVPVSFEALPGMGHAGIVVLDDSVSPRALAEHLFRFAAAESCGSCTPCRVGTSQLASRRDRASLERLLETIEIGSLCGFGAGVPRPIRDLLEHFGEEVLG
ncbi:MAG: SLBB domain-containing protein [Deltaproteobacteria bacterium]|nr:SLBB domain-containing protein [Deltaproteobacteria bacterium]